VQSAPWIRAYLNAARATLRARFHAHQLTELQVGLLRTHEWNAALDSEAAEPLPVANGSPLVGGGATLAIMGIGSPVDADWEEAEQAAKVVRYIRSTENHVGNVDWARLPRQQPAPTLGNLPMDNTPLATALREAERLLDKAAMHASSFMEPAMHFMRLKQKPWFYVHRTQLTAVWSQDFLRLRQVRNPQGAKLGFCCSRLE
jgi:hypothetical protein